MKNTRFLTLVVLMVFLGSVLTACAGGAGVVNSFPGLLVDSASETAYLASGTFVYSVNVTNGTERWRYPDKAARGVTFYAPPVLTQDGQLIQGAYDNKLYNIDTNSHQMTWTFDAATDKYAAGPLVVGSIIYAPNTDNKLYALDNSKKGALIWNAVTGHAMWSKPATDGKVIYAASMDHHVYAYQPDTGNQVWMTEELGGAVVGNLALSPKGVAYIGTLGSKMMALDAASGKTLWQTPAKGWVWASPLMVGDQVIYSDLEGFIYAVDGASGSIKWQIQPDTGPNRAITSAPVVLTDTLYVASQAGILYGIDLASGKVNLNKPIGGKIYTDLGLFGDNILVAPLGFTAALVSVDQQGNIKWSYIPAK